MTNKQHDLDKLRCLKMFDIVNKSKMQWLTLIFLNTCFDNGFFAIDKFDLSKALRKDLTH